MKSGTYTGAGSENYSLENINYDKNGNIQTLIQNGFKGGGTFGQIDQLAYVYQQNNVGNKLQSVSDAVGGNVDVSDFRDRNTSIDYAYDASGNLTQDLNKEIVNISYNRLNLPIQIGLTNGRWVKYYYSANGKKLRKETSLGEAWDYVGGFVYRADTVYQVAQPEGRLIKVGGQMVYEFEYNDHLNNGRLSFRDSLAASQNGVYAPPVITQENGYLPFGNRMVGLDYEPSNKDYFNYLSKERQDDFGINLLHLEQRFYDPVKGRFDTQDPVTDGQEHLSLYQYGWNNPVLKSDPNGDCPTCVVGAIFGAAVSGTVAIIEGKSATDVAIAAVGGAISGAIIGSGVGLIATLGVSSTAGVVSISAASGYLSGAAESTFSQGVSVLKGTQKKIETSTVIRSALVGAVANVAGAGIGAKLEKPIAKIGTSVSAYISSKLGSKAAFQTVAEKIGGKVGKVVTKSVEGISDAVQGKAADKAKDKLNKK